MIVVANPLMARVSYHKTSLRLCQTLLAHCVAMGQQLPDRCLRLLSRQCGVIAGWQAELGEISSHQIENLIRYKRWQRLQRGVYGAFTGDPPRAAVLWAAVLRAGPYAILSHETAAELDGLIDKPSKAIHVTVPKPQHRQPIAGLVIHRSSRAIGVRPPGRFPTRTMTEETVLDLAQAAASFDDVISLLARACQRRLTTPFLIGETLGLRAKMRWRAEIELALRDVASGVHSPLEHRYVRDVERGHGLPTPERQAQAEQHGRVIYRDARYREYGVTVELDGRASHPDERRWQDKHRDNAAAAAGIVTLRYGWADVTERSCETAREVATVLGGRGWPGRLRRCGRGCRV
jgi:predicted transcriptional regulator of viral defense system